MDTYRARDLFREISEAAHLCGDPGLQFDTTVNDWHTCPNTARINASQPLLRVHVPRRLGLQPGVAEPDALPHHRRRASTSRPSSTRWTWCCWRRRSSSASRKYPTEKITENSHDYRPLGLGYANLGALLMATGPAVRLGRGPQLRRRHHLADVRPGVPAVSAQIAEQHGRLRRLRARTPSRCSASSASTARPPTSWPPRA